MLYNKPDEIVYVNDQEHGKEDDMAMTMLRYLTCHPTTSGAPTSTDPWSTNTRTTMRTETCEVDAKQNKKQ
jgi:hypothetical protein